MNSTSGELVYEGAAPPIDEVIAAGPVFEKYY
jgi:hypothetical protein